MVMGAFFWCAYFCMGNYKHEVVVIKMGSYIHDKKLFYVTSNVVGVQFYITMAPKINFV